MKVISQGNLKNVNVIGRTLPTRPANSHNVAVGGWVISQRVNDTEIILYIACFAKADSSKRPLVESADQHFQRQT